MPVVTLTLCLSAEPWDAPTSLHEMLSVMDERLLKFVPDYKLNLLTPAQIADEDFGKFRTGLGAVMQFAKHRNDQDVNWMAGNKRFEAMDRETANLIKTVTGANIRFGEKGDVVNMWVAYENDMKQARNDGYADGRDAGYADGKLDMAMTFAKKYNIPAEEAIKTAGVSKTEWDAYEQSKSNKS